MTKLNENIKMTYTKEMEANFKISFDVDTRNFNNGKVVLDLFGSLAGEKSGFSLEFVPSEQGVVLKAGFVNDVTVKKIGEMTVAKEKEFNIKIARMGSNIYFGVDQQALGVMGSIYEGKVTPEFEFSNSNRGSSEIYLDSFYLEDVF